MAHWSPVHALCFMHPTHNTGDVLVFPFPFSPVELASVILRIVCICNQPQRHRVVLCQPACMPLSHPLCASAIHPLQLLCYVQSACGCVFSRMYQLNLQALSLSVGDHTADVCAADAMTCCQPPHWWLAFHCSRCTAHPAEF